MEKMLLKPSRVVFHRCVVLWGGVGGCGCWVCGYVGGYVCV